MAKPIQSESERIAAEELKNEQATKGRATPTRKDQEAARKRPLVGGKSPEAKQLSKEQQRAARDRARIGLAAGEEKYLPVRDRGPQKRFIRDYIDARWNFGELSIPVLVVILIIGFVNPNFSSYATLGLWALIIIIAIDCIFIFISLRRKLAAKFGADRVEKMGIYPIARSIQLRSMRLPKPQVKRGQRPS